MTRWHWTCNGNNNELTQCILTESPNATERSWVSPTDLHIYILDAVPHVHVISNHVDTDKLTTANGGTSMSSSASRSSQSR